MRDDLATARAGVVPSGGERQILRILTCGSVDDGKSTLLGRLLYDCGALPDDALATLERESKSAGKAGDRLDFSLLADGLMAEREQGITIDVAYRYFATPRRKFIVADAPGHDQYTRNMVTGASTADFAVILVDARKGLLTQTRRHAYIAYLLGIRQLVVAINKMDLVGYEQGPFDAITSDFRKFARSLGELETFAIPIVAVDGDNIVSRSAAMSWYHDKTLLDLIETVDVAGATQDRPLRLPVQWICRPHLDFRGYAGNILSGSVAIGDMVTVFPSGGSSRVKQIVSSQACADVDEAHAGDPVVVTLADEIDVSRGDMICVSSAPVEVADRLSTKVVWLGEQPMLPGRAYLFRLGSQTALAQIGICKYKIDVNTLEHVPLRTLSLNEIGVCELTLDRPVAFEPYATSRENGGFILVDRLTDATVGAGMIDFALRRSHNIHWQVVDLDKVARARIKRQRQCCIWFTGLSGAGKSSIANALEKRLHNLGVHTYLLDGDNVRHGLCRDLGFTEADRVENIRRVSEVAKLMTDAGLVTLVAFISPFRAERQQARGLFDEDEFVEVFVDTPLEVCEGRDPKGLYKKARQGLILNFTGVDQPYEPPVKPEVRLDTTSRTIPQVVDGLIAELARRGVITSE
ncbi:adenylyl-sulfate kinase [Bradyrhizobium erythrophlei]|uniref:Multifunctional fusion protein n=1 Tax=Bradyrhizobium erythrophlei TaxID=1437360 RepID=A0A1M7UH95_9BRAD|nr:adenylyl-sulfate kinase [Bradyrhizobium erythrophlei]SHN82383.1 adenylylsulfate kinase /sulfate adenylyltransferase subunit 1 [Bradyrhizobium erythrophlei]